MDIRKTIKNLLLVFVILSLGVLIYKEFSAKSESNATDVTATRNKTIAVSRESTLAPDSLLSEKIPPKQKTQIPSSPPATKAESAKVIAYYFHGNFRCTTCRTIEQYSHDAIHTYFVKELENEKLEFRPVNVEEPENRHFVQDYQLFSKALVLSLVTDGKEIKWKNLTDVWKLVRDKDKFFQYVKDEVESFLKET